MTARYDKKKKKRKKEKKKKKARKSCQDEQLHYKDGLGKKKKKKNLGSAWCILRSVFPTKTSFSFSFCTTKSLAASRGSCA
jgi:hypothetical protein